MCGMMPISIRILSEMREFVNFSFGSQSVAISFGLEPFVFIKLQYNLWCKFESRAKHKI